tara:strand:- start:4263 stop:4913 length:651 start_codon:yes stop_codon:yes gene_type:complete
MILNIYKPKGITSFGVVKEIRKIINEKVGHGGTLDPFAEGVLILGTGKDTKTLSKITNYNKSYTALIKLGETTNTLDPEGSITENKEVPPLNRSLIKHVLQSFQGEIFQEPPMFSAKKIAGKKLYELARKNIVVKRDPVKITIKDIDLINFTESTLKITTTCSKGTYIRVLGNDIAKKLGTVGYLEELIRTRVGEYLIEDSKTIEKFRLSWKSSNH